MDSGANLGDGRGGPSTPRAPPVAAPSMPDLDWQTTLRSHPPDRACPPGREATWTTDTSSSAAISSPVTPVAGGVGDYSYSEGGGRLDKKGDDTPVGTPGPAVDFATLLGGEWPDPADETGTPWAGEPLKEVCTPRSGGQPGSAASHGGGDGGDGPLSRRSLSVEFPLTDGGDSGCWADRVATDGLPRAAAGVVMAFFRRHWGILLFLAVATGGLAALGILVFPPLPWRAWVAFAVLLALLAGLVAGALPTATCMVLALVALLVAQVITPTQALTGFANTGVATVGVLFVVAEGIQRTGVLLPLFKALLGKPRKLWVAQLRLMIPVAAASAFLNNTPVVAMLVPVVTGWSRSAGFPVSKLLMLMNNAAVLGGVMTLLGTSTSLVVKALAEGAELVDATGNRVELTIFGITRVGAPTLAVGLLYMLLASPFLLKDRGNRTGLSAVLANPRQYSVALRVRRNSPIVGETVEAAGLRSLSGLYLIDITRSDGAVVPAPPSDVVIQSGDILTFAGIVETVTELYHIPGLVPATGASAKLRTQRHKRRLVEVVIAPRSALVGRTVAATAFRSRFGAVIVAVHRQGVHLAQHIGGIRFTPGDGLLLEAGPGFVRAHGHNAAFALVAEVRGSSPPREDRAHMAFAAAAAVAMVAVATAGLYPLLTAAAVAGVAMVTAGCLSASQASRAISLPVLLTVASSFGVSKALEVTGGAAALAGAVVAAMRPLGNIGILFGIYASTAVLSSLITNNAAVALVFPIAVSIVESEGLDHYKTLHTIMLAASASFSTPIGYTTNLLVHGPGGYTFGDWVLFGVPLQLVLMFVSVFLVDWLY